MGWYREEKSVFDQCVGRKIASVEASGSTAKLKLDNGKTVVMELEGDCCSSSYFSPEGIEDLKSLAGQTISNIEDAEESSASHGPYSSELEYGDSVSWHFLKFTTDKGHTTVDWRNDSNGYYDGWINASIVESN